MVRRTSCRGRLRRAAHAGRTGDGDILLVCATAGGAWSQAPAPGGRAYSTMSSFLWFPPRPLRQVDAPPLRVERHNARAPGLCIRRAHHSVALVLAGVQRRRGRPCAWPALYRCWWGYGSGSLRQVGPLCRRGRGRGDRTCPQVARTVGMALSRYQVQKARRAGTSVCSSGCQFRAPAAALAQL